MSMMCGVDSSKICADSKSGGFRYNDGCNRCSCSDSQSAACTRKLCKRPETEQEKKLCSNLEEKLLAKVQKYVAKKDGKDSKMPEL